MSSYPLTVFYDGACLICRHEIALMARLHRHRRLSFCDFSSPDYDEAATGLSTERLGTVIHARGADGTLMTGVEVFRAMWTGVGLGWIAALSRLPIIAPLLSAAYAWFACHRLRLTGRALACSNNSCTPYRSRQATTAPFAHHHPQVPDGCDIRPLGRNPFEE